jgi:hypothetical protein
MKEDSTMRSTPVYAPDGMSSFGTAAGADDRFDEGLVHNHNWAASGGETCAPTGHGGMPAASRFRAYDAVQAHERMDDGLVHNHDWAVGGK